MCDNGVVCMEDGILEGGNLGNCLLINVYDFFFIFRVFRFFEDGESILFFCVLNGFCYRTECTFVGLSCLWVGGYVVFYWIRRLKGWFLFVLWGFLVVYIRWDEVSCCNKLIYNFGGFIWFIFFFCLVIVECGFFG